MPRLIALDLAVSEQLCNEVVRIWNTGDAVLPLDQRMLPSARRRLAINLGASAITNESSTEQLLPSSTLPELEADDALVIATSGSTGAPKGVVHTHSSLRAHCEMVGAVLRLDATQHWWLCLPAAHIGGFGVLTRALHYKSTLSVATHVDDAALQIALRAGATHTAVVPTLIARHAIDAWQTVLVGGMRSGDLPPNAISTYGLTETCGGVVYDGRTLPGVDVRVENHRIMLRTPSMARAYRTTENTPLAMSGEWLDTGDLGSLEDGHLRIEGRSDDVIITGGNKVWPHIVEQRLREHPLVADVVVRGITHHEWGSQVCAWVQPSKHSHAPTLDMLRGHVKETLAAYCAPHKLIVVETIPRTSLGKVIVPDLPSA